MAIDTWNQDLNVLLVRAADLATLTDDLDDLLQRLRDSGKPTRVVVDLAPLDHVNSSNLSQFIEAHTLTKQSEGRFAIAGATGHLLATFQATKLDQILALHDDVALALADVTTLGD